MMQFLFQKKEKRFNQLSSQIITLSVPGSVPPLDFSQIEFPLMEVVNQSRINSSSISDMFQPRETNNSSKKGSKSRKSEHHMKK